MLLDRPCARGTFLAVVSLCALAVPAQGCASRPPTTSPAAPQIRVDGALVDCVHRRATAVRGRTLTLTTDVQGALGRLDVTYGDGRVSTTAVLDGRAELELGPDGRAQVELALGGDGGSAPWTCALDLVDTSSVARAWRELSTMSIEPTLASYTDDTGAIGVALVHVPAPLDTDPVEAALELLARHAEALGQERLQLHERTRRALDDGRLRVLLEQRIEGVPVLDGAVAIELDATGALRRIESSLLPDRGAEAYVHDEAEAAEVARALVGEASTTRVYFDGLAYGDGLRARAGWYAAGATREVLLADADLSPRVVRDRARDATVELHTASYRGGDVRSVAAHVLFASGDSAAASPTILDASRARDGDEGLWRLIARSADYYADAHRVDGWAAASIDPRYGSVSSITEGAVRAVLTPPAAHRVAYDPATGFLLLDRGSSDARHQDVVCHEYAHSMDQQRGGLYWVSALSELVADLGALYCEDAIGGGERWVLGAGVRDFARGTYRGSAGITRYDSLRGSAAGLGFPDDYRATFLVSHALHRAVTVHGMRFEAAEDVAFASLDWSVRTFPDFRERWLATMHDWARSGTHGVRHADVCAMARGLADTQLDGDYAAGAERGSDASTAALVCTAAGCPLCECLDDASCDSLGGPTTRPVPDGGVDAGARDAGAFAVDASAGASVCGAADPGCDDDVLGRRVCVGSHGYVRQRASSSRCAGEAPGSGTYACQCVCEADGFARCSAPARIDWEELGERVDGPVRVSGCSVSAPSDASSPWCAMPTLLALVWVMRARRRSALSAAGRGSRGA